MTEILYQPRIVENTDWAAIIFVIMLLLVALTRVMFEKRFGEFLKLAATDKYVKTYKDGSNIKSWFNITLFGINLLALAFLILLILSHFGYAEKYDWIMFVRIFTLLGVFIVSKYVIEKIIAISFNIEEFSDQFNLQKISYRTYIGLLLSPLIIILYFNNIQSDNLIYALIIAVLAINIVIYLILLKNYQNYVIGKLFYFILYLCALEIAPYYFMYYWFANS